MESLPRAYATLGLARTASQREARRRFRKLVKQWHPDRFANDPRGQAEAAERMRQINAAYDQIQAEWRSPLAPPTQPSAATREAREPTSARLRREAVDEIVRALGTDSPVDVFLKSVDSWWWWPLVVALLVQPSRAQPTVALLQFLLVALAAFFRVRRWLRDRKGV